MAEIVQTFIEHLIQASPLALLGGRRVLHTPLQGRGVAGPHGRQVARVFQFKYAAIENLSEFLGESTPKLMQVIQVNERTAQRRREQGVLSPEESDRIARIARVTQRAVDAFGDENQAREWLKRPNRVLQDVPPLELLGTDGGAVLVADELGRIESGDLY
jgi:putative toxin-antitoxin system antitoxin component (TIGR02293 family)